jgi:hypothetical protein
MATQAIAAHAGIDGNRRSMDRLLERNVSLLAAQQRARRGPTPEVFFVKKFDNSRLVKRSSLDSS